MSQDEEHLNLLSIFHYVCAGLAAMFACFPIVHLIVGLFFLLNPQTVGSQNIQPHSERFVGLMFVTLAVIFISLGLVFAACLAYAGRCLGRRKHYTFCLVMGGVACIFMPFGTILGVFSIVVLVRPSVKALFSGATPPAFAK